MLTQDTGSVNAGFIHGLVGIEAFVSRLLSSVRFVDGGDEGKSPSTDSSIPTIVDTSTAAAAIGRGEYSYGISGLSHVQARFAGVEAAVEEEDRYKLKQL